MIRSSYVSTPHICNSTEKNELDGYVTVPCPSKMTQRSSRANWLKV